MICSGKTQACSSSLTSTAVTGWNPSAIAIPKAFVRYAGNNDNGAQRDDRIFRRFPS